LSSIISIFNAVRFWVSITALSIILGTLSVIARFADNSGKISHKIASVWARSICITCGVQVELQGLENVDPKRAQIFVANHQSFFDIFALSGYLPVQLRWMAKASLFYLPFVGWAMAAANYVKVRRGNRKQSLAAFNDALDRIKNGASAVIFPEGTRSTDGTIGEFEKGSHLLSLRSLVPMVPTVILGTGEIMKKGSFGVSPGKIKIIFLKPVETKELAKKDRETILKNVRQMICSTFAENSTSNEN
jgi:1-acyl-sn-glycerol-3-phosphate acyltransferase